MDSPQDPFSLAVRAIRARMRSGRLVQGEQLVVSELARELRLSATPVREALARLAGEGLIEDRRGAGYFAWRPDAVDLGELHDLQADYLRGALLRAEVGQGAAPVLAGDLPGAADDPAAVIEARLSRLIQRGRSIVLQRAQALLADRLAPARRVELMVLPATDEWTEFEAALRRGEREALWLWVEAYAARRRAVATQLVAAMRSAAGS